MVSCYLLREVFERIQLYLAKINCLKTVISLRTISIACINKNKHIFASALVFRLPSSTGPFGFPSKVVTCSLKQLNKLQC